MHELSMLMYFALIFERYNLWFFISFPFDEKKRNKEKSIQNNASALIAYTPPLFWLANALNRGNNFEHDPILKFYEDVFFFIILFEKLSPRNTDWSQLSLTGEGEGRGNKKICLIQWH